jgi:hypothetical protein
MELCGRRIEGKLKEEGLRGSWKTIGMGEGGGWQIVESWGIKIMGKLKWRGIEEVEEEE